MLTVLVCKRVQMRNIRQMNMKWCYILCITPTSILNIQHRPVQYHSMQWKIRLIQLFTLDWKLTAIGTCIYLHFIIHYHGVVVNFYFTILLKDPLGYISEKNVEYQCITKRGHVYLEHAYVNYKIRLLKLTEDNSTQRTKGWCGLATMDWFGYRTTLACGWREINPHSLQINKPTFSNSHCKVSTVDRYQWE